MNLQPGACVYRKSVRGKKRGSYRGRYIDATGKKRDQVLVLPNGCAVRDLSIAESELRIILRRVTREAAGLTDPDIKNAGLSMRIVLARYLRHLRHRHVSRGHPMQVLSCIKTIMVSGPCHTLADFKAPAINKALATVADKGRSPRTCNVYRQHVYALAEWCMKQDLLVANPVARIERWDERADIRKVRRALTFNEATRLLNVSPKRWLFYAVQLWTGLRVAETAALQWGDLDLDGDRPCIRLRPETTKAKRADELPLHPSLAILLRAERDRQAGVTEREVVTDTLRSSGGKHSVNPCQFCGSGVVRSVWRKDLWRG